MPDSLIFCSAECSYRSNGDLFAPAWLPKTRLSWVNFHPYLLTWSRLALAISKIAVHAVASKASPAQNLAFIFGK